MTSPQQKISPPVALPQTSADDVYVFPVSFAQQRLWLLHQLQPESSAYNISRALRLVGPLDVDVFGRALNEIVRRHETLRTTFAMIDGRPMQVISEPHELHVPLIDLTSATEAEREAQELFTTEARRTFDLKRGPLFRVSVVRLSATEHVIMFAMHHIISDAWSVSVFVKEFTALYHAMLADEASPLSELPIQYADYAEWQRGYLQGEVLERQLAYWREQLQDAPPVLELPGDRPRPRVQTENGKVTEFQLSASLLTALKALSRESYTTLFMTLLAAFYVLLYRYSAQTQICVGTPVAGRTRAETEPLIGFFVNTLVLKADLNGDVRFTELLKHVREICIGAYAHQDVPFEMLVDELKLERSLNHSPLFQVLFTLQNTPFESLALPGLRLEPFWAETKTAKFDLTFSLTESPAGLIGGVDFNTDLFDDDTISRMAAHYQTLLEAVIVDPQQQISQLPLLTQAELDQLLVEWNNTATAFPANQSVGELFEQQSARTPEAVALVFQDEQITYRELSERANALAWRLRAEGIGPETRIGLLVERSVESVVALLGIVKAGGAYVPLDPLYPQARLAFMLADAEVEVLLAQANLLDRISLESSVRVITLDSVSDQRDMERVPTESAPGNVIARSYETQHASQGIANGSAPENLFYVMYTSGSTGQPKGVCVTHRNVVRLVKETAYVLFEDEVFLQLAPITFDASTFEIWGSLLNGGRLILMPSTQPSLEEIAQVLHEQGVTTLWLTAGLFQQMVEEQLPDLQRLKQLLAGGDVLNASHVSKVLAGFGGERLVNGYGPTESTTFACCHVMSGAAEVPATVPIGRPIANTAAYVLDQHLAPLPVGVVGELYLGGEGLARAYLNAPELTAEKFVPHPVLAGARLYRTGDVARWNAAGLVEFLGRRDRQIKLRGYRVEPGEVQAALVQHPSVSECEVIVREEGHKRLVAYVVAQDGGVIDSSELRAFLQGRLPEYMAPSLFVTLAELPLTANGKVDRRALPAPELGGIASERRAPRNETEATLVKIWGEVLGVAEVGVNDNFFALGGDSILCIQVVARASRVGLRFQPRQLFEHQTVAELAVAIGVVADRGIAGDVETRCEETREAPLTPIQRWFFSQEFERPQHWNQAVLLATREKLEAGALARAVRALTLRHEALRLRFRYEAGWKQYLLSPAEWQANSAPAVTVIDLKVMGPLQTAGAQSLSTQASLEVMRGSLTDTTRAALERAAAAVQRSIDLAAGPLLRVVLFELEGEQRLLLVAHHLVMDGVSWRLLLEELQRAYEQVVTGSEIELGVRGSSFVDWAERLAVYAASAELKAQAGYWETAEEAAQKFRLPRYFRQGENREWSQRQVTTRLSVAETRALLQEVPRVYGTQINEVLLTALGRVLSRWTGERRVVVELEGHGREALGGAALELSRAELELSGAKLDSSGAELELNGAELDLSGAVGWFTSLYPVVLEADWGVSGEALKAVKEQLRAIPDKGVSYGVWKYLQTDYTEEKDHGGEVSFNYLGQLDQVLGEGPFGVAQEDAGQRRYEGERRSFQLSVVGSVRGGELVMSWKYSSEVHRAATIERVAADYESALRELIAHCREVEAGALTPSDFPLVSMKQQQLDKIISRLGKARQL